MLFSLLHFDCVVVVIIIAFYLCCCGNRFCFFCIGFACVVVVVVVVVAFCWWVSKVCNVSLDGILQGNKNKKVHKKINKTEHQALTGEVQTRTLVLFF